MSGYTPALTKLVALRKTARGRLVGESNPQVRHSDETVALACRLHESGLGYKNIGVALGGIAKPTVQGWIRARRRTAKHDKIVMVRTRVRD